MKDPQVGQTAFVVNAPLVRGGFGPTRITIREVLRIAGGGEAVVVLAKGNRGQYDVRELFATKMAALTEVRRIAHALLAEAEEKHRRINENCDASIRIAQEIEP